GILDQFNPSLKNFVTMGKHYEKALTGVTVAAKGYFDALVKLGELASDSQGSKELGDTLFQMAEVHRQIQVQLEDVLKLFHSELLSQLEQKLDLDIKYLTATLKKYQNERKSKAESIERCQSQLKKLRRKSQVGRHPNKYGDREMQYVELMSRRQTELDTLVAVGYRSALTEERRRYCFLVDRQCSVTKLLINYHCKVRELLSQKLLSWQQSCSQPTKLPERALSLLRHTTPQCPGAAGIAEVLRHAKLDSAQSGEQRLSIQEVPPLLNGEASSRTRQQQGEGVSSSAAPVPRSLALPSATGTPQRAPRNDSTHDASTAPRNDSTHDASTAPRNDSTHDASTAPRNDSTHDATPVLPRPSAAFGVWLFPPTPPTAHRCPTVHRSPRALTPVPFALQRGSATSPPAHNPLFLKATELYATSTLPLPRKQPSEVRSGVFGSTLPRVLPLSAPSCVEALFPHSPSSAEGGLGGGGEGGGGGGGSCLLSFRPGDVLSLLISEPRDGWHYGHNQRTGRYSPQPKGWFPFSYTQALPNTLEQQEIPSPLLSKVNSTSMGQLDRLPPGGELQQVTLDSEEEGSVASKRVSTFRPRPYSMVIPNNWQNTTLTHN
ncbi:hypothetical protein P4O66_009955, partial [Electrophorus voltai]